MIFKKNGFYNNETKEDKIKEIKLLKNTSSLNKIKTSSRIGFFKQDKNKNELLMDRDLTSMTSKNKFKNDSPIKLNNFLKINDTNLKDDANDYQNNFSEKNRILNMNTNNQITDSYYNQDQEINKSNIFENENIHYLNEK